jgi:sugar O-acyltransferase (sialic acid O-acetyltransferase NeuD family)
VRPFASLPRVCPPERCRLHLPIGWKGMNGLRRRKMGEARAMGYGFVSYVASGTRLWADTRLGDNAIVQRGAVIEPFVRIGDGCCIYQRALIGHHAVLGDGCYVASDAVVGPGAEIGDGCVLGLGCTVAEGVRVGPGCFVGAGALVTGDAAGNGVYLGVPAQRQAIPADRLAVTG